MEVLELRSKSLNSFLWGIDLPLFPLWREKRRLEMVLRSRPLCPAIAEKIASSSFRSEEEFSIFSRTVHAFRSIPGRRQLILLPGDHISALYIVFGLGDLYVAEMLVSVENYFGINCSYDNCDYENLKTLADFVRMVFLLRRKRIERT